MSQTQGQTTEFSPSDERGASTLPKATARSGLTSEQAALLLAQDGPNELPQSHQKSPWRLFGDVVREPMFVLLIGCGVVYMALGDHAEAWMLLGFVVAIVALTFFQQRRTDHALEALKDLSSPKAKVIRDGVVQSVDGRALVVGDWVLIGEGDRVPADMELVEGLHVSVDESMLTGESVPVSKRPIGSFDGDNARADPEGARVFAGTLVTQGAGKGWVVATGPRSALGKIGKSLDALTSEDTPIQRETRRVVLGVAAAGLALSVLLALSYGFRQGDWLRGLLAGLTLAMAILPEELPVVLTLFLGLGAWRLAQQNVLARSIPAIEQLGATTVLCVDKTGTLTENRMAVSALWTPTTDIRWDRGPHSPLPDSLHVLLEYAALASHRQAFDPMETAITHAAKDLLQGTEHLHSDWVLKDDYPLASNLLAMSRVWQAPATHHNLIAAKGAPEAVMDLCHLSPSHSLRIQQELARMAADGLRVLGVAKAQWQAGDLPDGQHDFDFEFLGLLALRDPVRPEVPSAIATCRAAGIRVVMITGDHPATATAIARQAGLPEGSEVMTGDQLDTLTESQLQAHLANTHVYCRAKPAHKLRLVQALRRQGEVVAMTGDGVNDAPALKAAHIGVAMGSRGTDVARQAAALVLLKDDFSSLVLAVQHGRRVFANLRKAIVFVIAAHLPIIGLSMLPVLMGWPMLLMPVHVLFLELIIDPACAMVFEAQALEANAMRQKPRAVSQTLFDRAVLLRGGMQGVGLLLLLLALFVGARYVGADEAQARALTFGVMVLGTLALIHTNLQWNLASFTRPRDGQGGAKLSTGHNRAYRVVASAAIVLLALTLSVPTLQRFFGFASVPPALMAAGIVACLLIVLWLWCVKAIGPWSGAPRS